VIVLQCRERPRVAGVLFDLGVHARPLQRTLHGQAIEVVVVDE
jgi:hypothetical protein